MSWVRNRLPMGIAFVVGIVIIADYVVIVPGLQSSANLFMGWSVILAAFAYGIGALNIVQRGIKMISKREKYWQYTIIQFVFMILTLGIGLLGTIDHPYYKVLFNNMLAPLNVTMSSMLCFFIASAAFRVFRARNIESSLLLVAGIFVMLRNAPIGVSIWSGFPVIGDWFLGTWAAGGMRGIMIGTAIASVGFAVRLLLGYEKRWLGRVE